MAAQIGMCLATHRCVDEHSAEHEHDHRDNELRSSGLDSEGNLSGVPTRQPGGMAGPSGLQGNLRAGVTGADYQDGALQLARVAVVG